LRIAAHAWDMSDVPTGDAPFEEESRQPGELDAVRARADPAQGFQQHRPTSDELDDDDGYVAEEQGTHLEQQPSQADVEEAERRLLPGPDQEQ
jgi:hypothetical protein